MNDLKLHWSFPHPTLYPSPWENTLTMPVSDPSNNILFTWVIWNSTSLSQAIRHYPSEQNACLTCLTRSTPKNWFHLYAYSLIDSQTQVFIRASAGRPLA